MKIARNHLMLNAYKNFCKLHTTISKTKQFSTTKEIEKEKGLFKGFRIAMKEEDVVITSVQKQSTRYVKNVAQGFSKVSLFSQFS